MPSIVTKHVRINNARQFIDSFEMDSGTEVYLFIGYSQPWSNATSPPTPNSSIQSSEYDFWKYMLGAKKVVRNDLTHAIGRYDWTSNTVYRQYDSTDPNLYQEPEGANTFFVLNSQDNVYKCLFNNYGTPANDEPTGTSTGNITTDDGYIWKFMYNVSSADALKFKTDDHINVQTLGSNNGTAQWTVQQAASNGAIDIILVSNGGSGYLTDRDNPPAVNSSTITLGDDASATENIYNGSVIFIAQGLGITQLREIVDYNGLNKVATINAAFNVTPNTSSVYHVSPKITVEGDGSGVTAYANVSGGALEKINVVSSGSDFAYANVTITANSSHGEGGRAYAVLPPPGGHGSDAVSELGGYNAMLNVNLIGDESNTFTTNNDFRQVGLLLDPLLANGDVANANIYDQTTRLTLDTTSGDFLEDERISGETSEAVGFVVDFANTNATGTQGVLSLVNVSNGQFQIENIRAANSGVTAAVTSIDTGDLRSFSGSLLYLQNRESIERDTGQTEDFKLTFTF